MDKLKVVQLEPIKTATESHFVKEESKQLNSLR